MALIDYIDGANRDIYLHEDTVGASIHPIDVYKEYRTLRRTTEALRVWAPLMLAKGNDAKGGGKFTERYVVLLDGARVVPYNVSHTLTVVGTVITDDGQEGISCFDRSPLSGTTIVDINYVPPQVEVITISTGDAATIATVQAGLSAQGYSAARAGKIDNLDAPVSEAGGGGTAPTAEQNAAAVRVELATELGRVDAAISTRLATAGYTAPSNHSTTTIANAVLSAAQSSPIHANVKKINNVNVDGVGSSGNPWGPA
jgi:hypothetical protein